MSSLTDELKECSVRKKALPLSAYYILREATNE